MNAYNLESPERKHRRPIPEKQPLPFDTQNAQEADLLSKGRLNYLTKCRSVQVYESEMSRCR